MTTDQMICKLGLKDLTYGDALVIIEDLIKIGMLNQWPFISIQHEVNRVPAHDWHSIRQQAKAILVAKALGAE